MMPIIYNSKDEGEEEVLNFYKMSRKLKQETHNIYARLQSIKEDSEFISNVFNAYAIVPKFANLRCGLWYHPNFDSTCYFKSTDGHCYHWQFSLNRLNLNVLKVALKKECVMIVDSTRKGKLFPDSFSKTIPIWCCVMNRVLSYLKFGEKQVNLKLPTWVHDTERIQIEEKLEDWVDSVLDSGLDLTTFVELYSKPLQCVWMSRRTNLDSMSTFSLDGLDFIPIILLSASDPDHPIKTTSWVYIQGAGDDHESWAMGLTPQLFWDNSSLILSQNVHNGDECKQIVAKILESERKTSTLSDSQHIHDSCSISSLHKESTEGEAVLVLVRIGNSDLFIGNYSNFSSFPSLNRYFETNLKQYAYVCCCDTDIELSFGKCFHLIDNKKNKRGLEEVLGEILHFIEQQFEKGKMVCVLGRTGKNEEIVVALAVMCSLFNLDNNFENNKQNRDYTRQHLLDKHTIRKKLMFIQSFVNDASPSRSLMKSLNRHLLS